MKNFKLILVLVVACLTLAACEAEEDNTAAVAQKCLNDLKGAGTPADANACLAKIGSSSDLRVLRVKCALTFLQDGITQSEMVAAFKSLQGTPATGSPLLNLANGLAASSAAASAAIVDVCEKSKSAALILIANASKLGQIAQVAAGGSTNIAVVSGAIAGMDNAAVGEIAISIGDAYCSGEQTNTVCNSLNKALTTGGCAATDAACIGAYLKANCLGSNTCGH